MRHLISLRHIKGLNWRLDKWLSNKYIVGPWGLSLLMQTSLSRLHSTFSAFPSSPSSFLCVSWQCPEAPSTGYHQWLHPVTQFSTLLGQETFLQWVGSNTETQNWTVCRNWETLKHSILFHPEWNVFIKPLPSGLMEPWRRGGRKAVGVRGNEWLRGSCVFQTQQDWYMYKLTEAVAAHTEHTQV